jgi:hypothetical protein
MAKVNDGPKIEIKKVKRSSASASPTIVIPVEAPTIDLISRGPNQMGVL